MYELFILSKLLHRPMHGYLIQTILNFAFGPSRRVSWGTLIAAIDAGDDPRGKKQYRTTDAGRTRFLELMNDPGENNAAAADLFRIKVGCFGHVDRETRLRVMSDYRQRLTEVLSHSASMVRRLEAETGLSVKERRFALLSLDHQKAVAHTELLWLDSKLAELAKAGKPANTAKASTRAKHGF
jgi:DNA-binding PadR family transcriptional regulator